MNGGKRRRRDAHWGYIAYGALFFCFTAVAGMQAPAARAQQTSAIAINEVMWDGTEYLELYNQTNEDISLNGWTLSRQKLNGEEKQLTAFTDHHQIAAGDYFLVERQEEATEVTADLIISSLVLVNTGELVRLRDDAGAVVDQAGQLGVWWAGQDTAQGVAMERTNPALPGNDADNWHDAVETTAGRVGTPRQGNSLPPANRPPEAVISASSTAGMPDEVITFSAEDSSDPDDDALTYAWELGDDTTAAGVTVAHQYDQAGTYTVSLTVSDGSAEHDSSVELIVTAPVYSADVIISEFLPNPAGADTATEFIELHNAGSASVALSSWQLDDAAGGSNPYTIPLETTIPAGGFLTFYRSKTGLALNNDGDSVRLLAPNGDIKHSFSYDSSAKEGTAWAQDSAGQWVVTTTVTANQANRITAPASQSVDEEEEEEEGKTYQYSQAVVLNEFLPNPAGSDTDKEFIEIVNTSSGDVNLYGWQLDDEDGGSSPYTISDEATIAGGEIVAFSRADTGLALNNNGDSVRLIDPAGKVISIFSYDESVDEDIAYAKNDGGTFVLTSTPTEGEANVITAVGTGEEGETNGQVAGAQATAVALADIRKQEEGSIVTVEGTVSVPPGPFGTNILYVAGSGVQVYFSAGEYPELALGDRVKVTGEIGSYLSETRLTLAAAGDIVKTSSGAAPEPHLVKTGDINEDTEGWLVTIVGKVTATSGDTFYVDDGSGAIKVFIKETTGIDKPRMEKDVTVTITGVVSQTSSGYRLLPRFQDDVRLGAVAGLQSFPGTGASSQPVSSRESLGIALAGWMIIVLGRKVFEPASSWR